MNAKTAKKLKKFASAQSISYEALKKTYKKTNRTNKGMVMKEIISLHKTK